jgi:hypothetical protein
MPLASNAAGPRQRSSVDRVTRKAFHRSRGSSFASVARPSFRQACREGRSRAAAGRPGVRAAMNRGFGEDEAVPQDGHRPAWTPD